MNTIKSKLLDHFQSIHPKHCRCNQHLIRWMLWKWSRSLVQVYASWSRHLLTPSFMLHSISSSFIFPIFTLVILIIHIFITLFILIPVMEVWEEDVWAIKFHFTWSESSSSPSSSSQLFSSWSSPGSTSSSKSSLMRDVKIEKEVWRYDVWAVIPFTWLEFNDPWSLYAAPKGTR